MHIKQITISNFRSFRQQPEIQPFSPNTNCIVGRNGSGKSNLFDAIQFVLLSPRFATLRTEERQALLHEGSGSAAVNAFVEVVFDNSDNRFALENSDEVVLRRTVGSKKGEFFLQRKRATKQEVQSLLEGAGFSKSNPYFMVQQGKIQSLCLMSDAQRLKLLQEVAGTTLYEDKKAESLIKMEENTRSIEKINSILADIDERLSELKGEKEELSHYQKCDRTRKALEYALYDKELRKARHVLDLVEHERMEHVQASAQLHESTKQTHDEIQTAEEELKIKSQRLKRNRNQMQDLAQDKAKTVSLKTKLTLQCGELQEQIQLGEEMLVKDQAELKELEVKIKEAKDKLAANEKELREQQASLQQSLQKKDELSTQSDALYAKEGRSKEYSTKEERDKSLRAQVKELQSVQGEKQEYMSQQQDTLAGLRRSVTDLEKQIGTKKEELTTKTESLQATHKTLEEKSKEHYSLMDARKERWREAEALQDQVKEAKESYHQAAGMFRKSMPRATSMGIRALSKIVEEEKLVHGRQYFGMVIDNMQLKDSKYQTAVEIAAQNALFHVIVDTDSTAARLMGRLEREKLGRVTFLPMNQIRVDTSKRYPESNDVAPLLDTCLSYDPKVGLAMKHVFDRKMLARNAELASQWSEKFHLDCITLDGDLCSRKGALTGGYIDLKNSRLRAHAAKRDSERSYRELDGAFREADAAAKQAEQAVSDASQEVSRLKHSQSQMSRMVQGLESELSNIQFQLGSNTKQAERIENQVLPPVERELASIEGNIRRLEEEIGTDLVSSLSENDHKELAQLSDQIGKLQDTIQVESEAVEDLRAKRQRLEALLEDNLLRRHQELTQINPDGDASVVASSRKGLQEERVRELEGHRQNLEQTKQDLESLDQKLEELRETEETIKAELREAKSQLDRLKAQDMKNMRRLDEASEQSEKLMSKKSMNMSKRDSYMRKIQDLGSLPPPSELKNYLSKSISALESELEKVNKRLKKYSHVNKKAFDQYVNFSEQRESLIKRKEELDKGGEKVQELVESLDRKKDEAINRTFRGVSKHFAEVFKELVPLGAGELIMRTSLDDGQDNQSDDEMSDPETQDSASEKTSQKIPDVSIYRGIGVKVRFSAVGDTFIMSQLSGGQKALVALSLIFAIQRCDPAPFYIFDELDQALDSTYRQAVAALIERQAHNATSPTQFITSTFRPELVAIAKNCYGVSHQNKVSSIHHMGKNDALKFIANLMSEEEAVPGEISSVKAKTAGRKRRLETEEMKTDTAVTATN